ncbi:MAG: methyltransferase domain-containing protein, partial [Elusimicrobiota bacterium]
MISNTMKIDYGLKFYREIFALESLHFGWWTNGVEPNIENLKKAQENYIEFIMNWIPRGVKKVLDVGCGTGSVALKLSNSGYDVSCLSPDSYQQKIFLEKTKGAIPFYHTKFEDLKVTDKYDLILMCES